MNMPDESVDVWNVARSGARVAVTAAPDRGRPLSVVTVPRITSGRVLIGSCAPHAAATPKANTNQEKAVRRTSLAGVGARKRSVCVGVIMKGLSVDSVARRAQFPSFATGTLGLRE